MNKPTLKRSLGVALLGLYGVGVTVGAGIYVLVGKVAGEAGLLAPLSFILAAFVAGLTAISYGELASRYPQSAGEAVYVNEAFGNPAFATLLGGMVAATGLVSAAVISQGFVGYLGTFVVLSETVVILVLVAFLAVLAVWGITESVFISAIITVVEVLGLVLIIVGGADDVINSPIVSGATELPSTSIVWAGVANGAVLAFFAFIGFEDMVNVAEEVEDPERTIPRAILLTLFLSGILYIGVSTVAVLSVPLDELVSSDAPLTLVLSSTTAFPPQTLGAIAVFAVVNGALIQIIMASRVLYGLAAKGWLPSFFKSIWSLTRTPVVATVFAAIVVAALALTFPLVGLAEATSYITLFTFGIINIALVRLRWNGALRTGRLIPIWIPVTGALGSFGMVFGTVFS